MYSIFLVQSGFSPLVVFKNLDFKLLLLQKKAPYDRMSSLLKDFDPTVLIDSFVLGMVLVYM